MNILLKKYLKEHNISIEDLKTKEDLIEVFNHCDKHYGYFDIDEAFDICGEVIDNLHLSEEETDEIIIYRMSLVG